jgi:hypothetical protein
VTDIDEIWEEAIDVAVGGELIRVAPENEEYAQAVLQVLNRRFETLDGDYVVLNERAARPRREPRPPPGHFETLRTQGRVIYALIIRATPSWATAGHCSSRSRTS